MVMYVCVCAPRLGPANSTPNLNLNLTTPNNSSPMPILSLTPMGGSQLDDWLKKLWLEEGGGGSGRESYELTGEFPGTNPIYTSVPNPNRTLRSFKRVLSLNLALTLVLIL